jgi:hypothetical protein
MAQVDMQGRHFDERDPTAFYREHPRDTTPTVASFQVVPPLVRSIARAERCKSGERQRDNCWPAGGRQQRQAPTDCGRTSTSAAVSNQTICFPLHRRAERWLKRHRRSRRRNMVVTLSFLAIPFTDHAAPCRKALGRVALHPIGELRRAHQAGLHRDVGEVRGRDGLFVASCRRRKTAEHGDDLDHERAPSLRSAFVLPIV